MILIQRQSTTKTTLKKNLIGKKLQNIMDGKANPDYRMKFANKKGR